MLQKVIIKNLAIVTNLSVNFYNNFSTITGETGAGKSILLNALLLALGNKADSKSVKANSEKAEVTVEFLINNYPDVKNILTQYELLDDSDENLMSIRRVIRADGKSKAFINNYPIQIALLKKISNFLIYFHGQHEHLELLKPEQQIEFVDYYAKNKVILEDLKKIYTEYQENNKNLSELLESIKFQKSQQELLEYQLQELENADVNEDEWENITARHKSFCKNQNILTNFNEALDILDNTVIENLYLSHKKINSSDSNIADNLSNAITLIEEIKIDLSNFIDKNNDLEIAEEINNLEQRISLLHKLALKHKTSPENLFQIKNDISNKLNSFSNNKNSIEILEQNNKKILVEYSKIADILSERRISSSKKLAENITGILQELQIKHAKFNINIIKSTENNISITGKDKIIFEISANKDQPLQPIKQVISGGELARLSLALHITLAQIEGTPSMIFDEADVGIGGPTAAKMGKILKDIAKNTQIICITHSPQIAASSDHQYLVTKDNSDNKTQVFYLNNEQRIEEIARMLGGMKITDKTIENAKELLEG